MVNCKRAIALGFNHSNQSETYLKNKAYFDAARIDVSNGDDQNARKLILDEFKRISELPGRILIDITSMNRTRIAASVEAFIRNEKRDYSLTFSYCFSNYIAPMEERSYCALAQHGPVSRYFSGLTTDVDQPLAMVIGLGYEAGRAIGITEANDPSKTHLFVPYGGLGNFDKDVLSMNADLLSMHTGSLGLVHGYDVNDFNLLFEKIESLVSGLIKARYRVVIVPMGPKPFCLASLLVASIHRDASVWRASGADREDAVDRTASSKTLFIDLV